MTVECIYQCESICEVWIHDYDARIEKVLPPLGYVRRLVTD